MEGTRMTIIRTPRRWPGYRTHRRVKFAGTRVIRIPGVQDRDLRTIAQAANMAVRARHNVTYGPTLQQVVTLDRDWVTVDGVQPEHGWAVVNGFLGYRRAALADLMVKVRVRS
jgi:regulator of extracellular matrix RemA (YlzA/DUF370 family)